MTLRLSALLLLTTPAMAEPTYGLSLIGPLQLPVDFTHFPSANPDAPKGGSVTLGAVGSFDSLNPFIVRGSPAAASARVWETLLKENVDEGEAEYGYLAQSVDVAAEPQIGHLRAAARGALQRRDAGAGVGRRMVVQHPP